MLRHRPGLLALVAVSALLPAAVLHRAGSTTLPLDGTDHFMLVAIGALVAALASVGLTTAGVRAGDGRTVLLGTAFSTMTALLAVHGIATPGVIFGPNGVIAFAGGASLPAGGAVLALSALPSLRRPRRMAPLLILQGSLAAGIVALGVFGLAFPSLVPAIPARDSIEAIPVVALGISLFCLLAHRALRTFALTRRATDLLVALGCAWLGFASFTSLTTTPGTVGFYLGHLLELVGVMLIGIPVALDLRRGNASRPLVGDLTAAEVVASEEAYLGARVRALMVRLGEHDGSTEGHSRAVALLAVQVGEALNLPPATLRHLAVGGLLHDIGKLSVSGGILRKPGALSDGEYAEVKKHPEAGDRLLRELGGFSEDVLALVRAHHERLDGKGYPHGLAGPELGIGPRILAVCDVYDALVSDRVYREAWTCERAVELLKSDTGTAFDGGCVWALQRVLGAQVATPAGVRA